jgi:dihydrofolate reductase
MKIILVMALTADGMTGRDDGHFVDWSGREDKKLFVKITRQAGVIIMGSKTFDTIGKPLPGRKNVVLTRNPERISRPPELFFSNRAPSDLIAGLESEGYSQAVLAGGPQINTLFARARCIDEIVLTISPLVFGKGLSLFSDAMEMPLELVDVKRLKDQTVYVHYRVQPVIS